MIYEAADPEVDPDSSGENTELCKTIGFRRESGSRDSI
jgi:hypothetical protein